MKSSFTGYYAPTTEQYEILWKDALFVLDTNVLLNLYRLPTLARDELIGVLELLKDRLWIPHQVGLEFQRGRLTVIANERKSTEEALSAAQNVVGQVKSKVEGLQIDKRGLGIESQPLLDELERSNQKLIDAITAIHSSQLDVSSTDVVRQKLDILLDQKVGRSPGAQQDLDNLIADGEERFNNKIPPGFADSDKEKNPNDAYFIYDHIKYQRKFGDLILWKQLLDHVKEAKVKKVLFITADRKEDWWWREQGKTIGPHPELMREIKREGGVELFWMYSSVQFVEHANKYSKAKVSTESVAEIEQVAQFDADHSYPKKYTTEIDSTVKTLFRHERSRNKFNLIHEADMVFLWLSRIIENISQNPNGNPDFIASTTKGIHGYLLSRGLNVSEGAESTQTPTRVKKALFELYDGKISALSVIFILDDFETEYVLKNDRMLALREKIEFILRQNPITEIFVGEIFQGKFRILLHQRGYPGRFSKVRTDHDEE